VLDLYYWPTPNGHKITIFLEEAGLAYSVHPINIGKGEQFTPEYLGISPNNKIPAIVDDSPPGGGPPLALFESGNILLYLAEKTGRFLPSDARGRAETLAWLFWQMGGFGPMLGQNHHFAQYAPEKIPYAIDRYVKETSRLYHVLDTQLRGRDFVSGDYSIADMAIYPWAVPWERQGINLDEFPEVKRWLESVRSRPAVARAYEAAKAFQTSPTISDEAKKTLFGQSAETLRALK
jgi:GST-like protein